MRASQLGSLRLGYRWPTSSDERDGRPVYGMGGLDGLGGRAGGEETTSGHWDGLGGREPQPFFAKVRVAGSNPVVRSI